MKRIVLQYITVYDKIIRLGVRPYERLLPSILLGAGNFRYGRLLGDVGRGVREHAPCFFPEGRILYAAGSGKIKGEKETPDSVFSPIKEKQEVKLGWQ